MGKYLIKRLLQMVLVLFIVSFVSFFVIKLAPGDILMSYVRPEMSNEDIEALREELGLNDSIMSQYLKWGNNILHGNWGYSINNHRSVFTQICEKLPATMGLMGASLVCSLVVAIPLGLWSGVKKNQAVDHIVSFISYIGISIPSFWFGILLILLFALKLGWLPASGMHTLGDDSIVDLVRHAIMPVVIVSMSNIAVFTRYVRANAIGQMGEDYVLTAVSKGTPGWKIILGHVLKNCLLPIITLVGMNLVTLVTGSFIVESVFGWPGLGTLGISSVTSRDYPVIMGITMLSCTVLIIGNFLADILYTVVDPRIKSVVKEASPLMMQAGISQTTVLPKDSFQFSPAQTRVEKAYFERSFLQRFWAGLKANRIAMLCVAFLILIVLSSLFAFLSPQDPDKTNMMEKFALPSSEHWFGTDNLGRDYFTRCLYGGRVSIAVGVCSMMVSIVIGTLYGTVSGFLGGKVDTFMMRVLDILMSIPSMLLIIMINSMISTSTVTLVITIGIFSWMSVARIVRAETLSVKERDYVTAARNLGVGRVGIIFRHVIPNIISPVIVASSVNIARAILMESSLSYLGFGVQIPMASWGSMLQNAQSYIMNRPLLAIYPGILILLTVLSFNFLGDVLRGILEPRAGK